MKIEGGRISLWKIFSAENLWEKNMFAPFFFESTRVSMEVSN